MKTIWICIFLLSDIISFTLAASSAVETVFINTTSESSLYTDITEANRLESLYRIKSVPIKVYEFKYDKVEGRKKMGVLGSDAHYFFPESIEVVPSYIFSNKDRSKPSTTLENFPIVDKNVIFMHGVAALQELLLRFDKINDTVNVIDELFHKNNKYISIIESQISNELNQQLVNRKKLLDIENERILKEIELETYQSTQNDILYESQKSYQKALMEYESTLNKKRLLLQEEINEKNMLSLLNYEKEKIEKRELLQLENSKLLQVKKNEFERELELKKASVEIEKIKAEIEAKAQQERLNEDVTLRKLQNEAKLSTQKTIETIKTVTNSISTIVSDFLSKPDKIILLISIFFGLFVVYYLFIQTVQILREFILSKLGQPKLVRETSYSYWSMFPLSYLQYIYYLNPLAWIYYIFYFIATLSRSSDYSNKMRNSETMKTVQTFFQDYVILDSENMDKILQLAVSTRNSKLTKTPYRHVLFHGPPGTGKTLIARQLAKASGMDYAIMSGGDVSSLSSSGEGTSAVDQLHALFKWASTSSKGLLLFIDEAEAFLSSRSGHGGAGAGPGVNHDINSRNALNALLYQTGVQSTTFMMVLATNRPEDLDSAVLDRIDISMYIGLPHAKQRVAMVQLYKEIHIDQYFSLEFIQQISDLLDGFSGREISKLFISINHTMLLLKAGTFTSSSIGDINRSIVRNGNNASSMMSQELILSIVKQKILDHKQMMSFHRT